ncbi:MAG: WD40/YVTN/BNR-like repeat-containing protein [Betaproteobacteria bacterium]
MRKLLALAMLLVVAMVAGCGGGSSADAPPDVKVVAGDSSATVTWTNDTSVEYWVWVAQGPNVDTSNCTTSTYCRIYTGVTPPFIVAGLANGTTYSVTVNGRRGGGPGGTGSSPIAFVPRLAGSVWTAGNPLSLNDLLGVTYTTATTAGTAMVVAVGASGSIYWTINATTWTAATSGTTASLDAVQYRNGVFVAIGDLGTILTSPDAVTWTPRTSPTTNTLTALVGSGSGQVVAVGTKGTILVSTNSTSWAVVDSGTTADLYGIAYGNGRYVAVGAGGTMLTSTDGTKWTTVNSPTTADLRGIAYGTVTTSATATTTTTASTFIAVGAAGTVLASTDGLVWTARAAISTSDLRAVTSGTRFIAVGTGGAIYTTSDGITWQAANSGTTANLNSLTFTLLTAQSIGVGYSAVGDAGVNLTAF